MPYPPIPEGMRTFLVRVEGIDHLGVLIPDAAFLLGMTAAQVSILTRRGRLKGWKLRSPLVPGRRPWILGLEELWAYVPQEFKRA